MAVNEWLGTTNEEWSTTTNWSRGVVPEASDDVQFSTTSRNCKLGAAGRKCRSLKLKSGATYTGKIITAAGALSIGDATAGEGNVALDLTGITVEVTNESWTLNFVSTSGTQQTINFGSQSVRNVKVEGTGSSYLLESELKSVAASTLTHTKGTFTSNGKTIDIGLFSGTGASTRTLNIENSLFKLKAEGVTLWDFTTTTGLTFSAAGSTIEIPNANAQAVGTSIGSLFIGGGKTFGNLTVGNSAVTAPTQPALEVTGSNTWATIANNTSKAPKAITASISGTLLTVTAGGPVAIGSALVGAGVTTGTVVLKRESGETWELSASQTVASESMESFAPGIVFAVGSTQTVTGYEGNGKSGAPARLASAKPGEQFTMKKASGQVSVDWQRIKDSKVDAEPAWYAGANSVLTNTTNWKGEAPPESATAICILL